MDIQISIKDEVIKDFSQKAKNKLNALAVKKSKILIDELIHNACLREADRRGEGSSLEITESDVDFAATIYQLQHEYNRKNKKYKIYNVIITVLSIITGKILDWDNTILLSIAMFFIIIIGISSYIIYKEG